MSYIKTECQKRICQDVLLKLKLKFCVVTWKWSYNFADTRLDERMCVFVHGS